MKTIVIRNLVAMVLLSRISVAQNCISPDITESQWERSYLSSEKIKPGFVGLVKKLSIENVVIFTDETNEFKDYISGAYNAETRTLDIVTLPAFERYEFEQSSTRLILILKFVCTQGMRELAFMQDIEVVNNYEPKFSKSSYEILIPTPLPSNLDITMFMMNNVISATDQDLEYYSLDFAVTGTELFRVQGMADSVNKKIFIVKLITTQTIRKLLAPLEFTLTATDNFPGGTKNSSTSVIVNTNPDEPNIQSPRFSKPLYMGSLNDTSLITENISIELESFDESVKIEIFQDDANIFDIEMNGREITLILKKTPNIEVLRSKYLSVTLIAIKLADVDNFATILLNVESVEQQTPTFDSNLYEGSLTLGSNEAILELGDISIDLDTFSSEVTFRMTGNDAEIFEFTQQNNKLQLNVVNDFDYFTLQHRKFLTFVIEALRTDQLRSFTSVVVDIETLQRGSPKFEKNFYIGKITENELLLETITILEDNYNDDLEVYLDGEDAEYISLNRTGNKLSLYIKDNAEIPKEEIVIAFSIIVSDPNFDNTDKTSVFIRVESNQEQTHKSIMFEKMFYEGTITKESILSIEKIILNEETFNEDINIVITGRHSEFFTYSRSQNEISIVLKDETSKLPNVQYLQISLVATSEGFSSASANIVIAIERENNEIEALSFNKKFYEGFITTETILSIEKIILNEETFTEGINIIITGRHSEFFTYSRSGNNITLSLRFDVSVDTFPNVQYLSLYISAFAEGFRSSESTMIIFLHKSNNQEVEDISSFEKSLFFGSVNNNNQLMIENMRILGSKEYMHVFGDDAYTEYFSLSINSNVISLSLAKNIPANILLERNFISFKIIAASDVDTISTNVVVSLPRLTEDKILRFEKAFYIGSLDSTRLDLENIVLELSNYDDSIIFSLQGPDSKLFDYTRNSNLITIKSDVASEDLSGKVFLTLTIRAERNDYANAESVIFIHLPVKIEKVELLSFEKVNYRGSLSHDKILSIENLIIIPTPFDELTMIALKGQDSEYISYDRNDNFIQLKVDALKVYDRKDPLYFYVEALKFGSPKVFATVLIDIFQKKLLKFDQMLYAGKLNKFYDLNINPIALNADLNSEGVTLRFGEGFSRDFAFEIINSQLHITKSDLFNEDLIAGEQFLWFYIEASGSNFEAARSLVIIEVPPQPTIPIEECKDFLDPSQPYFEQKFYEFNARFGDTGKLGRLRVILVDPKSGNLDYTLEHDSSLNGFITILSGDLIMSRPLLQGIHQLTAVAINTSNNKSARASVSITVVNDTEITVLKTLAIEHLFENDIHNISIEPNYELENCNFVIDSVFPSELRNIFVFDSESKFLKNIEPFDRESELFKGFIVPQIKLVLNLKCAEDKRLIMASSVNVHQMSDIVLSDEIPFSKRITHLNIIILDVNDNAPQITNPPDKETNIGFPDADLLEKLMPQYLIRIEAFDLDEGLNAKIKFSISVNDHFAIDVETGIVFPLSNAMAPDVQIIEVTATDRDGDGISSSKTLFIHKINAENVVVIDMQEVNLNNVENRINQMSESSGLNLKIVNYVAVSSKPSKSRQSPQNTLMRAFVYAFNETNQLQIASSVLDTLSNVDGISSIEALNEINETYKRSDCNATGLIVAVSVLGAMLLMMAIGLPLGWFLYTRYKKDKPSRTNSKSSIKDLEQEPGRSSPIQPSTEDVAVESSNERPRDADIIGIQIEGTTQESSSSDFAKLNDKLMAILEETDGRSSLDSGNERRKPNVTFNNLVQRIEVISDDETKENAMTDTEFDDERGVRL